MARIGGDEFAVILRGCALNVAMNIAETIRKAIAEIAMHSSLHVTASIGVACRDHDYGELSQFIADADKAVYQAKMQGRNSVATIYKDDLHA